MAFMARGLDKISICSSKSAIRFLGTKNATTSPLRVMAAVFLLRQILENCAWARVTVNVVFKANSTWHGFSRVASRQPRSNPP